MDIGLEFASKRGQLEDELARVTMLRYEAVRGTEEVLMRFSPDMETICERLLELDSLQKLQEEEEGMPHKTRGIKPLEGEAFDDMFKLREHLISLGHTICEQNDKGGDPCCDKDATFEHFYKGQLINLCKKHRCKRCVPLGTTPKSMLEEDDGHPSSLTPEPTPNKCWEVVVHEPVYGTFTTIFRVDQQYFTIAHCASDDACSRASAKAHCEIIQEMFLKALYKLTGEKT